MSTNQPSPNGRHPYRHPHVRQRRFLLGQPQPGAVGEVPLLQDVLLQIPEHFFPFLKGTLLRMLEPFWHEYVQRLYPVSIPDYLSHAAVAIESNRWLALQMIHQSLADLHEAIGPEGAEPLATVRWLTTNFRRPIDWIDATSWALSMFIDPLAFGVETPREGLVFYYDVVDEDADILDEGLALSTALERLQATPRQGRGIVIEEVIDLGYDEDVPIVGRGYITEIPANAAPFINQGTWWPWREQSREITMITTALVRRFPFTMS